MSCYEWESGTIKLPTAEVTKVRKALIDGANAERAAVKGYVEKIERDVLKGTRSLHVARERMEAHRRDYRARDNDPRYAETAWRVLDSVLLYGDKLRKITAKDLDVYVPAATNRTKVWHIEDGTISLDGRVLTWEVHENNHSVERARRHPLAVTLFRILGRIDWTRGSGGIIVGNNEYNRDDRGPGGGGNYVVQRFPAPKPAVSAYRGGYLFR
jgi:hypothetical protein